MTFKRLKYSVRTWHHQTRTRLVLAKSGLDPSLRQTRFCPSLRIIICARFKLEDRWQDMESIRTTDKSLKKHPFLTKVAKRTFFREQGVSIKFNLFGEKYNFSADEITSAAPSGGRADICERLKKGKSFIETMLTNNSVPQLYRRKYRGYRWSSSWMVSII